MTEETALKHALLVPGTNEGEHARLALEQGGVKKISDLKELKHVDLGLLTCGMSATDPKDPAAIHHLNVLERRKILLIPLWYLGQDAHELSMWF